MTTKNLGPAKKLETEGWFEYTRPDGKVTKMYVPTKEDDE